MMPEGLFLSSQPNLVLEILEKQFRSELKFTFSLVTTTKSLVMIRTEMNGLANFWNLKEKDFQQLKFHGFDELFNKDINLWASVIINDFLKSLVYMVYFFSRNSIKCLVYVCFFSTFYKRQVSFVSFSFV